LFDQETGQHLRYGIGLHCGRAIVGEIGFARHVAFTALGETVNLAHALQDLARDLDVAAVISDEVFGVAGSNPSVYVSVEASVRGRAQPVMVRVVEARPGALPLDQAGIESPDPIKVAGLN
jgi:adenylate cyclase